ncbi:mitotic-spindle organizing gamma-tubulin ring associated-domain-containing protein [Spinellus fusiger]|nr:mitotic-spindle organizing gamma-tubulin ring associated-domain-containing protein [Spinellus fusiger]
MEQDNSANIKEILSIVSEIAALLNTNLDYNTLALCVSICERGVNPEALAMVIKDLRKEESARDQK